MPKMKRIAYLYSELWAIMYIRYVRFFLSPCNQGGSRQGVKEGARNCGLSEKLPVLFAHQNVTLRPSLTQDSTKMELSVSVDFSIRSAFGYGQQTIRRIRIRIGYPVGPQPHQYRWRCRARVREGKMAPNFLELHTTDFFKKSESPIFARWQEFWQLITEQKERGQQYPTHYKLQLVV